LKFSIITVCYNSGATLEETIRSVLSQTHKDVEYIIVDGDSRDNTKEIVDKYREHLAHFISEPDKGIYDAMNKGLSLATGEIIGILNSDDIYKNNDVLSKVAHAFQSDIDCLGTDVEIFDGTPDHVIRYYSCAGWKPWMLRIGHQPPHPGFFVRRKCYDSFGLFDTGYRSAADFDLLLRFIYKHECKTVFQAWTSVAMRSGGESQRSFKNIARANREVHNSLRRNGYISFLSLCWTRYLLKIFQFRKF